MGEYPNVDCLESDWKLFRKKLPGWQEAYMEKLLDEYRSILDSDGRASERFWALEKRINSDKEDPGVQANVRRSWLRDNIMGLLRDDAITLDDLADFSPELRDEMAQYVKILEKRRRRSR